jgi:hypothetical protein
MRRRKAGSVAPQVVCPKGAIITMTGGCLLKKWIERLSLNEMDEQNGW